MLLLYIAGLPGNASTLLQHLLQNHPEVFSIGEAEALPFYARGSRHHQLHCSCGKLFHACPFWESLAAQGKRVFEIKHKDTIKNAFKLFETYPTNVLQQAPFSWYQKHKERYLRWLCTKQSPLMTKRTLPLLDRKTYQRVQNSLSWYQALHAFSEKKVLVDSSKNIFRLSLLRSFLPQKLRVVHLIRDGRAYLASMKRKGSKRSFQHLAEAWLKANMAIVNFCQAYLPERTLLLSYDKLCLSPLQSLQEIIEFLGLAFPLSPAQAHPMLTISRDHSHAIGGNPQLFAAKPTIQLEQHWRQELDAATTKAFFEIPGMKKFYHRYLPQVQDLI